MSKTNLKNLQTAIHLFAIQGKLIPQSTDDTSAGILLKQLKEKIQNSKQLAKRKTNEMVQSIVKENDHYYEINGNIKTCIDELIPFEIPDSWIWCRFKEITINRDSERVPLSKNERINLEKKYDYYGASGIIDKIDRYLFSEKLLLIGEDGANLLSRSTPIAFFADGQYWVNNHAHVIDCPDKSILDWICIYINSIDLSPYVTGTAQPKMNQEKMNSILIALPPKNEQKRIIEKINELEPLIQKYTDLESKLTLLDESVKSDIKKSIINYAIQGKLINQDINEKPIITQNNKNIIKELPFVIPNNWTWVHFSDIAVLERGNGIKRNETIETGLPCIRYGELYTTYRIFTEETKSFTSEKIYNDSHKAEKGNLLMTLTGETKEDIGKTISYEGETPIAVGGDLAIVKHEQNSRYMSYLLNSPYVVNQKAELATGDQIIHLGVAKLETILLPIPPVEEQERIVRRIEELLTLADQLPN